MDPVSGVLGIASGTVTLAALALKAGQTLRTVVSAYSQGAPVLYSLIGACQAIEVAWNRINAWIRSQGQVTHEVDSSFYDQLAASIEVGKVVLGALQRDIEKRANIKPGLRVYSMWKALLDGDVLRDHSARLKLQLSSLHLLLAATTLPVPEARTVLCDCLKPVFRKDEESAWTIVASAARSSLDTPESVSGDVGADDGTLLASKNFSFTNDLLTAPVYKRLTLHMLSLYDVLPSNAIEYVAKPSLPSTRSKAPCPQERATFATRRQTVSSTRSGCSREEPDVLLLIDRAARTVFSSSAVYDLSRLKARPWDQLSSRYLPIHASLKRKQMTSEERDTLDLQLLDATQRGSVFEMAAFLDGGADINAASSRKGETALHIATTTHQEEDVVLFLLLYKNVNLHVRDCNGRTLLHGAVSSGKTRTVQWLLDQGLSMTEEDENRITPFNIAAEKFNSPETLSTLLKHARSQGANGEEITEMDPTALHTACSESPICVSNALLLLQHGWSPNRRFRVIDGEIPQRMSSLHLAILKREDVLVGKMLDLDKDLVQLDGVHGPQSSLLNLAMRQSGTSTRMVLLLLHAGFDYRPFLSELLDFAVTRNDPALSAWLDEEGLQWKEPCKANDEPCKANDEPCKANDEPCKANDEARQEEDVSQLPQSSRDPEIECSREKRASIIRLEQTPATMLVL